MPKFRAAKKAKPVAVKQESHLEVQFKDYWRVIYANLTEGIPLDDKENCQLMVVPGRQYKFDFGWQAEKVLVEVHGGLYGGWSRGRHVQPQGFTDDRSKINAAQELGYIVLEYTAHWFGDGQVVWGGRGKNKKIIEYRTPEAMIEQIVRVWRMKHGS